MEVWRVEMSGITATGEVRSMQVRFTPAAAREILQIMRERGPHLALRIQIRRGPGGFHWDMRLEPFSSEVAWADGVPVVADAQTWRYLDGMVIDWTETPEGPGIGVFNSSLYDANVLTAG